MGITQGTTIKASISNNSKDPSWNTDTRQACRDWKFVEVRNHAYSFSGCHFPHKAGMQQMLNDLLLKNERELIPIPKTLTSLTLFQSVKNVSTCKSFAKFSLILLSRQSLLLLRMAIAWVVNNLSGLEINTSVCFILFVFPTLLHFLTLYYKLPEYHAHLLAHELFSYLQGVQIFKI